MGGQPAEPGMDEIILEEFNSFLPQSYHQSTCTVDYCKEKNTVTRQNRRQKHSKPDTQYANTRMHGLRNSCVFVPQLLLQEAFFFKSCLQYTTQLKQRLSMFTGPGAVKVSTEHNLYFCVESM